jgi:beta-mannosidase
MDKRIQQYLMTCVGFGLLLLSLFSCTQPASEISLNTLQWQFGLADSTARYPACVPGTVHTDLLANGLIADPFYGTNEAELQWIGEQDWVYEAEFAINKTQLNNERIDLHFGGLDTYADVYLNGQLILRVDNMFRSWEVDVHPFLKLGNNQLRILFRSAVEEARKQAALLPCQLPGNEEAYTRKAAYHFGWDWGPRFVTAGIWKDVKLRFWNSARIAELHIIQDDLTDESAALNVRIAAERIAARDLSCKITLSKDGKILSQNRTSLNQQQAVHEVPLLIQNPQRWWTHQLGQQHLYEVLVELYDGTQLLDRQTKSIGLRTIELVQEKDSIGQSFYFKLNGVPIYAKGANVIPQDNFLPRVDRAKHEQLIDQAMAVNMNMLRVWGGGVYESDDFYTLCDQKGLLVWQDFMFACSMYRGDSAFVGTVKKEVEEQVKRLRHHPSIALWCGNNEIIEGWHNWGWQKQLGYSTQDSLQLISDYQALFEQLIPDLLQAHDPQRPYHLSSPANGWGRDISYREGDVHYWGVWWGMESFERYKEKVGRFVSEYGFQGMPAMSSLRKFIPQEELFMGSSAIKAHQKHPRGFETIAEYMQRDFPVPNDLAHYAYVSQLLQAYGIQMAIEAHRAAKPYNMGTLYWQLNDCWPVTSWSSIDWYGTPKALHYALKDAFADVLIVAENEQIRLISDLPEAMEAQLHIHLMDFGGDLLSEERMNVNIPAFGNIPLTVGVKVVDSSRSFLQVQLWQDQRLVAEKLHYYAKPKNLQLQQAGILITQIGSNAIRLTAENYLAKNVFLFADGLAFSENYFDLPQGQSKVLQVVGDLKSISDIRFLTLVDLVGE